MSSDVRHEALINREENTPSRDRCSGREKLRGQVKRGDARETGSSPDNVAARRHCQTPRPRKRDGKVQRK